MKHFFTGLIAALFITSMATQADARRGGGATTEELILVSPTKLSDDNGPLFLCHFVTTESVLFINLWRTLESYALANNSCISDNLYILETEDFLAEQAAGAIPADIPVEPKMSTASLIGGFWGLGAIALAILLAIIVTLQARARRGKRMALMGNASPTAQLILDAMCHAAKADGTIDASEVAEIKNAAEQMTGEAFSASAVQQMADLAETDVDANGCKRFLKGLSQDEYIIMMRGVLSVVAADGNLDGKEQQFVGNLAGAMNMSDDQINQIMDEVTGVQTPA